jgi:hypothetical protein
MWPHRQARRSGLLCPGRGTHQLVHDDIHTDPATHAVFTMVATAIESVSAFEHTDPAFTADAPPLSATEPALVFLRAPRWRLRAVSRHDHAPHATVGGGLLVRGRAEAAITGRYVGRAAEDGLMAIQRRGPQRHVGRSRGMDLERRDDLVFRFLNRDQLAELIRRGDRALPDLSQTYERCS